MRDVERVVHRSREALDGVRDEPAVRQCRHLLGERREDLGRRLLRRSIEAREPRPAVFVLTLRPRLQRALRVLRVRADEVQTAPGGAAVRDLGGELGAGGERFLQVENQVLAVVVEVDVAAVDGGGFDLELDRIERERRHLAHGLHPRGASPRQRLRREIERDVDTDMKRPNRPIGGVVKRGSVESKRRGLELGALAVHGVA